jgi:hypothetical protein
VQQPLLFSAKLALEVDSNEARLKPTLIIVRH